MGSVVAISCMINCWGRKVEEDDTASATAALTGVLRGAEPAADCLLWRPMVGELQVPALLLPPSSLLLPLLCSSTLPNSPQLDLSSCAMRRWPLVGEAPVPSSARRPTSLAIASVGGEDGDSSLCTRLGSVTAPELEGSVTAAA